MQVYLPQAENTQNAQTSPFTMVIFQCILRYHSPLFDAIDDWVQRSSRGQAVDVKL